MHSEPKAYNLPVTSSPYLVNIATIVGKAGTMRTLELDFDAPERIGEGSATSRRARPLNWTCVSRCWTTESWRPSASHRG